MNLNRGLIKQQARTLIKNNVMSLFAISFVIMLCTSIVSYACAGILYKTDNLNFYFNYGSNYNQDYNNDYNPDYDDDTDHFDGFGSDNGSDFHNFGTSSNKEISPVEYTVDINNSGSNFFKSAAFGQLISLINLAAFIITAPLAVTLLGYYVLFIRGRQPDIGDGLEFVFKAAFNKAGYGKKIAVYVLKALITAALTYLLIVPGIIFSYSSYFACEIMCDYPQLSPWQAIQLSKKMVKGNRTELFVLDLSFIPWYLICCTLFPLIYVIPYVSTTRALYYENFRIRAIQQGRVTEDDFLTEEQKYQKYVNMNNAQYGAQYNSNYNYQYNAPNQYYHPNGAAPQQPIYYTAAQAQQSTAQPQGAPQQPTHYTAAQTQQNTAQPQGAPQQPTYYTAAQTPQSTAQPQSAPQQPRNEPPQASYESQDQVQPPQQAEAEKPEDEQ